MKKLNTLAALTFAVLLFTSPSYTQTFNVLYNFQGAANGGNPGGLLAQGRDGNLFGTAGQGAHNGGIIFSVTTEGNLTAIFSRQGEGNGVGGGLTLGTDGEFYGSTPGGGLDDLGTVFKIAPGGKGTLLYSFTGGSDGSTPVAAPIQVGDGKFYGTTDAGTAYEINSSGVFTALNTLPGPSMSPLVLATDGNFYGTSYFGGTSDVGTVYRMSRSGEVTILYSFDTIHGAYPVASLMQATNGKLYGATQAGGTYNDGVLFELEASGIAVMHNFGDPNYPNDGIQPLAGLIQATDGNLYGVTVAGGGGNAACSSGCGVIFRMGVDGTYSILHAFDGSDGAGPRSSLIQHTNGNIYGLAPNGGTSDQGNVYSLSVALGPFVRSVPSSGTIGQIVGILGQGLTGTTSVTLNGMPMTFTVVSDTFIKATVPTGATTGYVTVSAPSGTLTSNVPFHVIP
jgi:uncharacterized repeat protein (TIGR03803 family)